MLKIIQASIKWRSIICKHNVRWQDVSWLKVSAVISFQKTHNINKTCQQKPGKSYILYTVYLFKAAFCDYLNSTRRFAVPIFHPEA
jgi:hypothetical protein